MSAFTLSFYIIVGMGIALLKYPFIDLIIFHKYTGGDFSYYFGNLVILSLKA